MSDCSKMKKCKKHLKQIYYSILRFFCQIFSGGGKPLKESINYDNFRTRRSEKWHT